LGVGKLLELTTEVRSAHAHNSNNFGSSHIFIKINEEKELKRTSLVEDKKLKAKKKNIHQYSGLLSNGGEEECI
jgi:hypothetical protein